ncbi:MAG: hypothetical protein JKY37_19555 [Nannocystaceae bacterium]|nr:hypothetical protein [Nannocystaceae bacterium]
MAAHEVWPLRVAFVVGLFGAFVASGIVVSSIVISPDGHDRVGAIGLDPAACASCHPKAARQWRGSLHAHAWDDPVFVAEYAAAPAASCRGCHDPAGEAGREHGIDCATCHVRDGAIVVSASSEAAAAAHPLLVDPSLNGVTACGWCHQFEFTDDGIHDPTELLQATVDEWASSQYAERGETCTDCHMPRRGASGGHVFLGLNDPSLMASAVDVVVHPSWSAAGLDVHVKVTARRIGHAFPTGDVFRRAVLSVRTDGGAQASVSMQRWLARTADDDGQASHVRTVEDTRVPPPGRGAFEDTLHLGESETASVHWALTLYRLPLARARKRGLSASQVAVPIAAGTVAVPPIRQPALHR